MLVLGWLVLADFMDALIIESMTSTSEVQESKTYDVQAYSRPLVPDADLYTDSLIVRLRGE